MWTSSQVQKDIRTTHLNHWPKSLINKYSHYKSNVFAPFSWSEPVLTPALEIGMAKSGSNLVHSHPSHILSSVRRFLTEDATKTLVTSYILSRLDYCNCLLMGTPNSVIQPLQKIQNFAARLVLLATRHHHSTPLLEKLHWLPISECIKYKVACMCFSTISGSGPAYLSELLHVYTPSRTLRSSSDTCMLEIQQYKCKTHGFRTFSCFGPHIWNSLPQDLRHCSTLSSFKAELKTYLFSQYFHPN